MLMCRICLPARHRVSRKLFHCQQAVACLQKKNEFRSKKRAHFGARNLGSLLLEFVHAAPIWSPFSGLKNGTSVLAR